MNVKRIEIIKVEKLETTYYYPLVIVGWKLLFFKGESAKTVSEIRENVFSESAGGLWQSFYHTPDSALDAAHRFIAFKEHEEKKRKFGSKITVELVEYGKQ